MFIIIKGTLSNKLHILYLKTCIIKVIKETSCPKMYWNNTLNKECWNRGSKGQRRQMLSTSEPPHPQQSGALCATTQFKIESTNYSILLMLCLLLCTAAECPMCSVCWRPRSPPEPFTTPSPPTLPFPPWPHSSPPCPPSRPTVPPRSSLRRLN